MTWMDFISEVPSLREMTYIPPNLCIILLKFSREYILENWCFFSQSLQIDIHRGKQFLCILWKKESESRSVMSASLRPCDYTVHEILQVRILEWIDFPFSRPSPQPRDRTQVSCIAGRFFTSWATREAFSRLSKFYRYRDDLNLALIHCTCLCISGT